MSFSGIKYRRTKCDNIQEMLRASSVSPQTIQMLTAYSPTFSFIRLDEMNFVFKLILPDKVMSQRFRLGEEFVMERNNGTKLGITFTLEGNDVLNQIIRHHDGKVTLFRREFGASNKMLITAPGMNQPAVIYYEQVK